MEISKTSPSWRESGGGKSEKNSHSKNVKTWGSSRKGDKRKKEKKGEKVRTKKGVQRIRVPLGKSDQRCGGDCKREKLCTEGGETSVEKRSKKNNESPSE